MDKVSVIIPTWNRANTLDTAITSILQQSYPIYEIIICDDGSDDHTHEIVASFNNDCIKWLPDKRAGRPAVPRNRGIAVSSGDWIAFLDSDDSWLPDKIEKQLHRLHSKKRKASCTNAYIVDVAGNINGCYGSFTGHRIKFSDIILSNHVICSSSIIHSSLVGIIEGFPENENLMAMEDYALWLRVATQTDFYYINEPLVKYRDAPELSIRAKGLDTWQQRKIIFGNLLNWMEKNKTKISNKDAAIALQQYNKALSLTNSEPLS